MPVGLSRAAKLRNRSESYAIADPQAGTDFPEALHESPLAVRHRFFEDVTAKSGEVQGESERVPLMSGYLEKPRGAPADRSFQPVVGQDMAV